MGCRGKLGCHRYWNVLSLQVAFEIANIDLLLLHQGYGVVDGAVLRLRLWLLLVLKQFYGI